MKDQVFHDPAPLGSFKFNKEVASVFDDMVNRSVPFYRQMTQISASFAAEHAQADSCIYDLGCSTASTMLLCDARLDKKSDVKIIGYDPSADMLERAEEKVSRYKLNQQLELRLGSAQDANLDNASVVIMNLVLQFIPAEERLQILQRIYEQLEPGGLFILSEKVTPQLPEQLQQTALHLYDDFKEGNHYSRLEIAHKRQALENVLVPWSLEKNQQVLEEAGFEGSECVFRWVNFATIIAWKAPAN